MADAGSQTEPAPQPEPPQPPPPPFEPDLALIDYQSRQGVEPSRDGGVVDPTYRRDERG